MSYGNAFGGIVEQNGLSFVRAIQRKKVKVLLKMKTPVTWSLQLGMIWFSFQLIFLLLA